MVRDPPLATAFVADGWVEREAPGGPQRAHFNVRERGPQPATKRSAAQHATALLAETLLLPGVGVVVVAVALPEAEDVVIEELEPADPLGTLPEERFGTNNRSGQPCSGSSGRPSYVSARRTSSSSSTDRGRLAV